MLEDEEDEEAGAFWSFPGLPEPGSVEIGREIRGGNLYIYYIDAEGNRRYTSERTIAFEKLMQKNMRERRRKKLLGK